MLSPVGSDAPSAAGPSLASWSGACLEARGLAAVRGARVLFKDLSFTLKGGEIVELRGPNGSGKSTLLRILAGLGRPAAGDVKVSGGAEGANLHFLGHLDAIKPNESAREQARFWARFHGRRPAEADSALAQVGLASRALVPGRGLSAGQKRRLAVARLLIEPRPIWLLDEPAAALDTDGRALLERLAAQHVAGGGLIIAAVHGAGFAGARVFEMPSTQIPSAQNPPSQAAGDAT